MKTETTNFADAVNKQSISPVFVLAVSFDDADTDITYITSHGNAQVPGGTLAINRIDDALDRVSGFSQKIDPKNASHSIGNVTFTILDHAGEFSTKVNTKLGGGEGLRKKRVILYVGDQSLSNWSDYSQRFTYIVDDYSIKDGVIQLKTSDIQRLEKTDIFSRHQGTLTSTINATATTIPVTIAGGATKFQLVDHDANWSANPSDEVGYIRIDDEIICHDGWTDGTYTALNVVERGALNTRAATHTVDAGLDASQTKKVVEYIYLEMAAPRLIYALLTGDIDGQSGKTLPDGWHLGLNTSYVRLTDFQNVGEDLWDTSDNSGRMARFMGETLTEGKEFIEKQILLWLTCFMPVYADGAIGLKRLNPVLPNSGFDVFLDEDEVIDYGELHHDMKSVINNIVINWNYIDYLQRHTKLSQLIDATSISINGTAPVKTYDFRGVFTGVHSDNDIRNYFRAIRDRYGNPPLRLSIRCQPQWARLEVGDRVRLNLTDVHDYNTDTSINRTFEIQQVQIDWFTGIVTLDLFGGIGRAEESPETTTDVLQDSYYTGSGTELGTQVTIAAGVMTANGSITGGATNSSNEFYYDGDLEIQNGVTLTVNRNVILKVKGFLTINGAIDVVGQSGDAGFIGTTNSGWASLVRAYNDGGSGEEWHNGYIERYGNDNRSSAQNQELPVFNIANEDGTASGLTGIPDNIAGEEGSTGKQAYVFESDWDAPSSRTVAGGAGGAGGGGLVVVSRGATVGPSGQITTDGSDGTVGSTDSTHEGKNVYGQTGAGGFPGCVLFLIDGNYSAPSLSESNFDAFVGAQAPHASVDHYARSSGQRVISNGDTGYGQNIVNTDNHWEVCSNIQYIPPPQEPFTWLPNQEANEVPQGQSSAPNNGLPGQVLTVDSQGNQYWSYLGPTTAAREYCPGYTYVNVDTDTWRIEDFDVTKLFAVGRRLRFNQAGTQIYGTISSVDYDVTSSGDTTINMTMEDSATLDGTIVDVCVTPAIAVWVPISTDPFQGTPVNDICAGYIGGTKYWIAGGNGGRLFYSTDGGSSWTSVSGLTMTEAVKQIGYNPTDETFLAVANDAYVLRSTDGINWTEDRDEISTLAAGGASLNARGCRWDDGWGGWIGLWDLNSTVDSIHACYSNDDGVNWSIGSNLGNNHGIKVWDDYSNGDDRTMVARDDDVYHYVDPDSSTTTAQSSSVGSDVSAAIGFTHNAVDRRYIGFNNGDIREGASDLDDVTLSGSKVNEFCWIPIHQRVVAVCDDSKIAYLQHTNFDAADQWVLVSHGFNPLTHILTIHWDDNDGVCVAGAANGQICRSANGIT